MEDLKTMMKTSEKQNLMFYRGVVEDNNDPDKLLRVKVRIFGLHVETKSGDFEAISTDNLPWAEVMGSTSFGLVSGIGVSSVLRQGTWVWVILENNDPNKPIVIGTITGKNSNVADTSKGFNDPDGVYPSSEYSSRSDINKDMDSNYPDIAVLETQSGHKITFDDKENASKIIVESSSGHKIELDDTNGAEKVVITHKLGSNISLNKDGSLTIGSANENIPLGSLIADIFSKIAEWADKHTHPTPSGVSLQPNEPLAPDLNDATNNQSDVYSNDIS